MAQGDLLAVVGRYLDRGGQIICHGSIRLHLPALDHVLQQHIEEDVSGGLDVEQGVAIGLPVSAVIQVAATDNPWPMLVHQTDHHTAMWQLGMDILTEISGDSVCKLLRRGCKW